MFRKCVADTIPQVVLTLYFNSEYIAGFGIVSSVTGSTIREISQLFLPANGSTVVWL
jgi:hypothetical protein